MAALNQELERREMGDAIVRMGGVEPSLDVDPKWLRDRDTATSIERMWFSKSGLVLPLRAREGGY